MGLEIVLGAGKEPTVGKIVAAKDLYLNAGKDKAVAEGPDAAFLLARKGLPVPREYEALVTAKGHPKKGGTKEVKPSGDK